VPGAACQACAAKISALPKPSGNINEPLGTCQNCHSLTCGHHGHRDPNVPEFMCVECDPNLLAASAVLKTTADDFTRSVLAGYHLASLPSDIWRVKDLADFLRRRPGYGEEFFVGISRVDRYLSPTRLAGLFQDVPATNVELLGAAVLILRRLELPLERLPRHLVQIRDLFQ